MLFTSEEIKFVRDAHDKILRYMSDMRKGNIVDREFPTFKTISQLRDLHRKGRSIQDDVDEEQNNIKKFIVKALENFQIIKIEKRGLKDSGSKPQTISFRSSNEPDNEQIIKIRNKKNLLSLIKRQCDNLVEGLGSVKHGVKTKGEDILVGSVNATTGGANAIWEYVLEPTGRAIAEAIDQAIITMKDAVRRENINDANKAIRDVVGQAQLVIDNSLKAIENALHILEPSLSPKELTDKAKEFIEYDSIEQSLIAIIEKAINLQEGVWSSEEQYIDYFNNKFNDVQTAVNSVVDIADSCLDDARQELLQNFTLQQEDKWLLKDFKEHPSLSSLKKWLTDIISNDMSARDIYVEDHFFDITSMLHKAKVLSKQKNDEAYLKKFDNILEQLDLIFYSESDKSMLIEKLHEAVDNIAEFDSLQYALEHKDKFAPFLEKAEHFLIQAQESQDKMVKPLKKAKNALKASYSFAAGVLRLGEKGLNYILSNIQRTIVSIWDSTSKFITSIPEAVKGMVKGATDGVTNLVSTAVDKLLEITGEVTSKISTLSGSFLESMRNIIGIRKSPEKEDAIYQHQAFQPEKIRTVIQSYIKKFDDYEEDSNDYVIIAHKPNKEKPYPYRVTTTLKFKDHKNNMILVKEVDLMVVYKDSIHFTPALDVDEFTKKGLMLPMQEEDKFNDAQLELIKILGNDERGLLSTPRAESIKIKHFNDQGMEVFLDTRVMREHSDKVQIKDASPSVVEELKHRRNLPKKSAAQKSLEEIDIRAGHVFKKSR